MRRYSLIARRIVVALSCSLAATLAVAASAQAVVITDNGTNYGVALVPSAREPGSTTKDYLDNAGIPIDTTPGPCLDPAASTERDILSAGSWPLSPPYEAQPICWHNGPVMHADETIALEWEGQTPNTYWKKAKTYVQNFLSDIAATSGQLVSPYSDATQYWDGSSVQDRAAASSLFGGGCDDNGTANCQFGAITGSGSGNPLPSAPGDCNANVLSGYNVWGGTTGGGAPATIPNNICVTDTDIQHEVKSLIANDGLVSHIQPGHTPLVTVMTPPGVEVCLDPAGNLCSANGGDNPEPPTVSSDTTGGHISAGTYEVVTTYVIGGQETLSSAPTIVTTTGATSTITVASPAQNGASGWYVYVNAGSGFHRQGPEQTFGTDDQLTALTGGAAPPTTPAVFCSYHGQVTDPQSGQPVSYVVQPWTAFTICDEPDVPVLPANPSPDLIDKSAGQRLVSPLSQSSLAAIVNPQLNGWFGLDGLEIDDQNACQPLTNGLDTFTFGTSGSAPYYLQRESNNTSVVDSDPFTYAGCLPNDVLDPGFVAPTAIDLGDTIDLDGSGTASSLDIPNANYSWSFGDGTTGTGPSVAHTYSRAGNFTVTLTVTDRGGNVANTTQTVQVLGSNGQPAPPPSSTGSGGGSGSGPALNVHLQLLPQSLKTVLHNGISVRVTSNRPANGIATVSITRISAKKAGIKVGRAKFVRIGVGTVSSVKDGTVSLRLHLSKSMAKKLSRLHHVAMTIRLALVSSGNQHVAVDAAGRY